MISPKVTTFFIAWDSYIFCYFIYKLMSVTLKFKEVYLVPAPDMDERAIDAVQFDDFEIVRVSLPPLTQNTDLDTYIAQLTTQIRDPNPILIGFCYGGLLAIEIGKRMDTSKIVIVSGIKDRAEIPLSRRLIAMAFLCLPSRMATAFGCSLSFTLNQLLRLPVKIPRIWLKNSQNKFIVKHALGFNPSDTDSDIVRIHGENDRVVPLRKRSNVTVIKDAGHFMFVTKRKEMLRVIAEEIGR